MKKIRSLLLLLSFILFPITIFYFSPYLIIIGAIKGLIVASFITFIFFLIASMIFGRAFCDWIMPCGGLQEICFSINNKKTKGNKLNLIKFIFWIPWLITIIILFILNGKIKRIDYFFKMNHGISIHNSRLFIIYYSIVLLFMIFSIIFGKCATCHYLCWMFPFMIIGRKLSNILHIPALRLKSDKSKCTNCKICNKNCPMSLDVDAIVLKNNMENYECILCGTCVDSCPGKVIKFFFGQKN